MKAAQGKKNGIKEFLNICSKQTKTIFKLKMRNNRKDIFPEQKYATQTYKNTADHFFQMFILFSFFTFRYCLVAAYQ